MILCLKSSRISNDTSLGFYVDRRRTFRLTRVAHHHPDKEEDPLNSLRIKTTSVVTLSSAIQHDSVFEYKMFLSVRLIIYFLILSKTLRVRQSQIGFFFLDSFRRLSDFAPCFVVTLRLKFPSFSHVNIV